MGRTKRVFGGALALGLIGLIGLTAPIVGCGDDERTASDDTNTNSNNTNTDPVSNPPQPGPEVTDFALVDVNPTSATAGQQVSPRDFLQKVSGWYFTHSS